MTDQQHPWRGLLIVTAICIAAGVFIFANYFYDAFPEASVKFDLTRGQALDRSAELLRAQGAEDIADLHHTIIFSVDRTASNYLEREVGLERANRLMADSVAVWSWYVRYFRPLQKLEYEIHYTPSGRLVKYSRYLEEAAAGAFLSLDSARVLAQQYLIATTGLALGDLEEKIAEFTDMPERRDHKFEWELRDFRAKEATQRYRVEIQGDEIGFFREYVKVPEAWQREYKRERASNELFGNLAELLALLLAVGVVVTLFRQLRQRNLTGRIPLVIGVILAIGLFLVALNSLPLVLSGYDTTDSYASFFLRFILMALFGSAMIGALVWLAAQSGEPLYRRLLPEKLSLEGTFTAPATRTRAFARATVAGYAMAFGHIGAVILFYLFGKKVGFWAPQEVDYSNAVSAYLPWLYPLVTSFYAATFEEFGFRLFAIPFLKKIFRSTFPAVLLPALIWGFLHSSYPQAPGWVRGIEVGAIGVVAGYVMLRFGILATLVWHYTVDAFLIGFFLLKSGSTYLVVSGVIVSAVLLVPLAIALAYVIRRRSFASDEALTNRELEAKIAQRRVLAAPEEAAPPAEVTWQAPRWSRAKWLISLGLMAVALVVLSAVPLRRLGEGIRWKVDPAQAELKARSFLAQQNLPVEGWRCAVSAPQDGLFGPTVRYLMHTTGLEGVQRFVGSQRLPVARFEVRFFKPLQKETRSVIVGADGDVVGFVHTLDEKAPGDSLTQDSARALGEAFLTSALRFDTSGFYVLSAGTNARDARVDHAFTYQTDRDSVGSARLRVDASVAGSQPSGGGLYLHVPEEWQRQDEEATALGTLARFLIIALWAALALLALFALLRGVRSGELKWRSGVGLSLLWGGLALISLWSSWPIMVATLYDTSKPFASWTTSTLAAALAGVVILSLLIFMVVPLMRWLFEKRAGRPYSFSGWAPAPDAHLRQQSVAGAILAVLSLAALSQVLWWLTLSLGLPTRTPPMYWISYAAFRWPFASLLSSALGMAILLTAVVGFVLLWILPRVRNKVMRAGVILLLPLISAIGNNQGSGEVLGEYIRLLGMLLLILLLLRYYLQESPVALFGAVWLMSTIPDALLWLHEGTAFYVTQGILMMAAALLPVVVWVFWRRQPAVQV